MKEIKAPEYYVHKDEHRTIFIAGGISNCENWQATMPELLAETELVLLNPRREGFDITNPLMEQEQIEWEHLHILEADSYLFWFCEETLCPITLFELGKIIGLFPLKPIFVGTHPKYARHRDIKFQMLLMRPEIHVVHTLSGVTDQVVEWAKQPFLPHKFS
jgi:hypothetical protein